MTGVFSHLLIFNDELIPRYPKPGKAMDHPIPLTDLGVRPDGFDAPQSVQQDGQSRSPQAQHDSEALSLLAANISTQKPTTLAVTPNHADTNPQRDCSQPSSSQADTHQQGVVSDTMEAGDSGIHNQCSAPDVRVALQPPSDLSARCPDIQPQEGARAIHAAHGSNIVSPGPPIEQDAAPKSDQIDCDKLFQQFRMTDEIRALQPWITALWREGVNAAESHRLGRFDDVADSLARAYGQASGATQDRRQVLNDFFAVLGDVNYCALQVQRTSGHLSIWARKCGGGMSEKPWNRGKLSVLITL